MSDQIQTVPATVPVYYDEPYLTELDAKVLRVEQKGSQYVLELDRTIFYPEGGGQPSDQGQLAGQVGSLRVDHVRRTHDAIIIHQGKLIGELAAGEAVKMIIKWPTRYKNMRVHSAGHLIHDVLMTVSNGLAPTKGNHGPKSFLEYVGSLDPQMKDELESKINGFVDRDLPIITRYSDYDEIVKRCSFVPANLPQNKSVRIIQIGDFDPMPDGGVQVKSTSEIGRVILHNITPSHDRVVIRYGVAN